MIYHVTTKEDPPKKYIGSTGGFKARHIPLCTIVMFIIWLYSYTKRLELNIEKVVSKKKQDDIFLSQAFVLSNTLSILLPDFGVSEYRCKGSCVQAVFILAQHGACNLKMDIHVTNDHAL